MHYIKCATFWDKAENTSHDDYPTRHCTTILSDVNVIYLYVRYSFIFKAQAAPVVSLWLNGFRDDEIVVMSLVVGLCYVLHFTFSCSLPSVAYEKQTVIGNTQASIPVLE